MSRHVSESSAPSPTRTLARNSLAMALVIAALPPALASRADSTKADNATPLNNPASWLGNTLPTSADVAIFDSNLAANSSFSLGDDLESWLGIRVTNPTNPIIFNGGNTLTLGAAGIDLSNATQPLTIASVLNLSANQTWNNSSTLTISSPLRPQFNGYTVTIQGSGVTNFFLDSMDATIIKYGSGTLNLGLPSYDLLLNGTITQFDGNTIIKHTPDSFFLYGGTVTLAPSGVLGPVQVNGDVCINSSANAQSNIGPISGTGIIHFNLTNDGGSSFSSAADFSAFSGTVSLGASTGMLRVLTNYQQQPSLYDLGTNTASLGVIGSSLFINAFTGGPQTSLVGAATPNTPVTINVGQYYSPHPMNTTFAGSIRDGAGPNSPTSLFFTDSGTLTLTGTANTFSGSLILGGYGVLAFDNPGALGADTTPIVLGFQTGTPTIRYVGPGAMVARHIVGGGIIDASGAGPLNLSADSTLYYTVLTGANTGLNSLAATIQDAPSYYPPALNPTPLQKTGSGTWVLANSGNTYSGGTFITAGKLIVSAGGTPLGSGPVTVNGGGTLQIVGPSALKLPRLSIVSGAMLDLTNAQLILQSTDPADKQTKITQLNTALTANTITSSANPDPAHYTLALFDNALLNLTQFGGQPTDTNSILTSIAHLGDADNNGIVDIQDLTIIANHWQTPQNNWAAGDLNRDNIVDIQDFTLVANNWQQSSSFPLNPSGLTSQDSGPTNAPEPASLLLLAACPLFLSFRRPPRPNPPPTI